MTAFDTAETVTPDVTVTTRPGRKPRAPRPAKLTLAPKAVAEARPPRADQLALQRWSAAGVYLTLVMSALLNGYANAQYATMAWAGWLMGLATPALVLILSRVSALQYRRKKLRLAAFTASVGIGLLLLSVWHCATSIALLTGSHLALAIPFAIAIDAGLVACELANVVEA